MIGDYSINPDELLLVIDSILDEKGLVNHHIESSTELYEIGLQQIITQVFEINITLREDVIKKSTEEEKNIDHLDITINFSDVRISRPTSMDYDSGGMERPLYPNEALIKEKTYQSTLRVDVKIKIIAYMKTGYTITKEDKVENLKICKIPIMVKSRWCNTHGLSNEALTHLNEDPSDPGGYFIIRGVEWSIDCVENILFNKVRIFKNEGYKKEIMRAEFISKPGDYYLNSDQFIIRWLNDGQISVEIRREKLKEINIPFYLIFRMMGWTTDKQIFDNVLFGYDNPTSKKMYQYLVDGFNAKYNNLSNGRYKYTQHNALMYVAEEIRPHYDYLELDKHPENYQTITNFLLKTIDTQFLQFMGMDMNSRERKMRYLCLLIRKMFLVNLGSMETTDRDSYNSKRIHPAGTSYAKSFKTNFNASIVQPMRRKISKDLKTIPFGQINLASAIKTSISGSDFEQSITRAITAGNKSQVAVSSRLRTNRLSSQLLNRKNQLNVYSTLRQVTAMVSDNSKQSERASEMRRVHMSTLGYICVTHSPEGEKVGINKQLALSAFITKASSGEAVKSKLLNDPEISPLINTTCETIETEGLNNVFVNGDWIGCCKDALYMANKYRMIRRASEINPEISIVWDPTQNEVYFWTDVGRVIRPLLIVYNNQRNPEMFGSDKNTPIKKVTAKKTPTKKILKKSTKKGSKEDNKEDDTKDNDNDTTKVTKE
jgi:DNA-directed RNA polymerase II subunit RPB2